jgi:EF hand
MKVVPFIFILSAMLALGGVASADEYGGPPPGAPMPGQPMPQPGPNRMMQPRGELRQALLDRFDQNHDGRLEPNERRHAIRALRRMERQLARGGGQAARTARRARLRQVIRRYDLNGDGNVDQGEMPPDMARRLRPLDRNGDGWVDQRDER